MTFMERLNHWKTALITIGFIIGLLISTKLWLANWVGITPGLDKENAKRIEKIETNDLYHLQQGQERTEEKIDKLMFHLIPSTK
jgi:hypothetical protein